MTHRYHTVLCSVLCLILFSPAFLPGSAQGQASSVDFEIEAVSLMAQGQATGSRVDVYTRMPLTELAFQPSPEGFTARYRIGAEIVELDENGLRGNIVESPVWDRTVRVASYGDTQDSQRFDYTTQALYLQPGRYAVELSLQGEEGGTSFLKEQEIRVKNFDAPVSLSDLLLLEDYNPDAGDILPSVSNRLGSDRVAFSVMYEVYLKQAQTVQITRELFRRTEGLAAGEDESGSSAALKPSAAPA